MNDIILSSIYKQYAILCDNNPDNKLSNIWEECKRELQSIGFPKEMIAQIDFENLIKPHFFHRILPYPDFWKNKLSQNISFFMVEAQSKDYERLLDLLKNYIPDVTNYVCYGEKDVIIRFLGNKDMVDKLEDIISKEGFSPIVVSTSEIILFYDKEIPENKKYTIPKVDQDDIDKILASNYEDVDKEIIEEFENSGLMLNSVIYEDTHFTSRIRAIIGLETNRMLKNNELSIIEKQLCSINDREFQRRRSRPISSIYKCTTSYFAYIFEGIFDDQEQLDFVTDFIQNIDFVGDTETIIIAKASFSPFSYSLRNIGELDNIAIMDPIMKESVLPLSQSFAESFPKINPEFLKASTEKQFLILSIFNELVVQCSIIDIDDYPLIMDYLSTFFEGILERKKIKIRNTGHGYLRDVVEVEHLKFVKEIVENVLNSDLRSVQEAFGASDAKWKKWGLYPWGRIYYPNWNNQLIYGNLLTVPDEVLNELEYLGLSRNKYSHTSISENEEVFDEGKLREVFLRSYRLLSWLEIAKNKIQNPVVSLDNLREIVLKINPNQMAVLSNINIDQREIKAKLEDLEMQEDQQYNQAIKLLEKINNGVLSIDEKSMTLIRELVIPQIEAKSRSKAEKFVDSLRNSASSLPKELAVELLAGSLLSFLGKGG